MKPKISIVIPCYNHGIYIDEAVDSILAQTFQDFEIIIVNDGSTEELTNQKLDSYDKPKTRVIKTENQGLPNARNNGIKEAKGEYIVCLDSDDKLEKSYLEKCLNKFETSNDPKLGIVTTNIQTFENNNLIWEMSDYNPVRLLVDYDGGIHVASMFKRKIWEEVGGYPANLTKGGYEDRSFWISIVAKGYTYLCIKEPIFWYRVREGSMIADAQNRWVELMSKVIENNKEFYQKNIKEIVIYQEQMIREKKKLIENYRKEIVDQAKELDNQNQYISWLNKFKDETINSNAYKIGMAFSGATKNPFKLIIAPFKIAKVLGKVFMRLYVRRFRILFYKFINILFPPQKIAFVCSSGFIGGAERVMQAHIEWASKEYKCDVFLMGDGPLVEPLSKVANVYVTNNLDLKLTRYKYIYLVQAIPNLVQVKLINPKCKVSYIIHAHTQGGVQYIVNSGLTKYIDKYFAISEYSKKLLLDNIEGLSENKVFILHNPYFFGSNEVTSKDLNNSSKARIGYIGRISPEKNPVSLVRIFKKLINKYPGLELHMAGDSSMIPEYKQIFDEEIKDVPQIKYYGLLSDTKKVYETVDFVALASFTEGVPLTLLEAMSYGIPVIAPDVGGISEVVKEGKNGILVKTKPINFDPFDQKGNLHFFDEDDINSFVEGFEKLLSTKWDSKKISEDTVNNFSPVKVSEIFMNELRKLV